MIIILMGVSGSGKTTIGKLLAESLGWDFIDADDFHSKANIEKMSRGIPLDDGDRLPWLEALATSIDAWLKEDKNIVLACSALKVAYRQLLLRDKEKMQLVYLKGSFDLISERMKNRQNHFMIPELLLSQFNTLEEPEGAIAVDASLSTEQIVSQLKMLIECRNIN